VTGLADDDALNATLLSQLSQHSLRWRLALFNPASGQAPEDAAGVVDLDHQQLVSPMDDALCSDHSRHYWFAPMSTVDGGQGWQQVLAHGGRSTFLCCCRDGRFFRTVLLVERLTRQQAAGFVGEGA
jgi:hypothetical protein